MYTVIKLACPVLAIGFIIKEKTDKSVPETQKVHSHQTITKERRVQITEKTFNS